MKRIASIALAATLGLTGLATSTAPIFAQSGTPSAAARIELAQVDEKKRPRFERRGNDVYLNGQRGSRERRSGWREYNGYWFPVAAFSALMFGIIANEIRDDRRDDRFDRRDDRRDRRAEMNWNRHQRWCDDRYRSYRWSDNSFQPYHGPRQTCVSPYWPR